MTERGILLSKTTDNGEITAKQFSSLIRKFEKSYLAERNFNQRLRLHRNPSVLVNDLLRQLNEDIIGFQGKDLMRDFDPANKCLSYVPSKIKEIRESDRRIDTLYHATKYYCKLRAKPFYDIAFHMAEYCAMNNLFYDLRYSLDTPLNTQSTKMAKNFTLERRQTYDTEYLKVFLKEGADYDPIQKLLTVLPSVKKANITDQKVSGKRDLTVYHQKAYDIEDLEKEVNEALTAFFKGGVADPSFKKKNEVLLSDQAYFRILDEILILGKGLESSSRLSDKFDEEGYRDYFIPHLNSISTQFSTKGEVFNKKGKTDILVFDHEANNIFIAECKLWKGEAYLISAVDQLLDRYVTWRDEKTAIIIFNQTAKNFTEIIDKATKALKDHPRCKQFIGHRKDTSYSYIFQHPSDDKKTVKLELVLFNFV